VNLRRVDKDKQSAKEGVGKERQRGLVKSAKGAKYDSQGQVRSEASTSPLVHGPKSADKA